MKSLTRAAATAATLAAIAAAGSPAQVFAQRISQISVSPPIGGISCDAMEGNRIHIHQHLLILDHGTPVPVPSNVGRPFSGDCLYWVHTHTPDGVIHIESPASRTFTLGDFFAIWGQPLTSTRASTAVAKTGKIKAFVDGKPYDGDPAKIPLTAHADIVLEVGPPFPAPPRFTDWQGR